MREYLFPVEYKADNHWDTRMIGLWRSSGKTYLSFSFNRFNLHTLPEETFWLYLYYTKTSSEEPRFQGKLRYRFQVIHWSRDGYDRIDTYSFPSTLDARVWFLCDLFQKVKRVNDACLAYEDFYHADGKNLASSLRNSMPSVVCTAQIYTVESYP